MFVAFISNAYAEVKENVASNARLEDELKEKHWSSLPSRSIPKSRKKNREEEKAEKWCFKR